MNKFKDAFLLSLTITGIVAITFLGIAGLGYIIYFIFPEWILFIYYVLVLVFLGTLLINIGYISPSDLKWWK